jgi:hypothetical protein
MFKIIEKRIEIGKKARAIYVTIRNPSEKEAFG